ncbi:MAG TPA: response regulator [Kiritimatiellia bacterium]|nr:response regulator [Kiritimatiellia bacterium]
MIHRIRHLSIERKLTLIVFLAITSAMVLASSLMIGRYARSARLQNVEDLATLADIIGNNSKAALSFQDADDAVETLAALEHKPIILSAFLYDQAGAPFARYDRVDRALLGLDYPEAPGVYHPFVDAGILWKASPIFQNHERIGTLILQADLQPIQASIRRQIMFAVLITAGSVLLAVLLASRVQHFILRHIRRVVDMANAMALGDLPAHLQVTSDDEIGELERAFNQIVDTTRDVVRQTQTLAQGDYSIRITPRSERDELSHALIGMTRSLNAFHEESLRRSWLKTALGNLDDSMRGEPVLADLLRQVVACMVEHTGAQAAVLYMREDARTLAVAAAHAVDTGPEEFSRVTVGRGLVGQVAADRRLALISDPEGRPLVLQSGMLDHALHHVALMPLLHDASLIGVLELGRLAPFTAEQQELLRMAGPTIAIAIESAQSRKILNELLAETQRQSRVLQEQQTALQESNRALEQRNELLEQQKQEIHRQNKALEAARLDLERKARELEQASRYKSEFLANMSHELRTPLNSMLILSRLLSENKSGNLNEKQVEFARTIYKSGSDLLTLINDILDLSKVEAGMLEITRAPVPLDDIVNALGQIFRPLAAEKGIAFTIEREAGLPTRLMTDAQRVGQILRNLCGNAFKFTSSGSVTLRMFLPDPPKSENRAIGFSVIDTGIGIPPDKHEMIFRAFQQADGSTSRQYGGTGLGLSISRELALRLGGDITLESEAGRGSTFTLWLPDAAIERAAPVDLNGAMPERNNAPDTGSSSTRALNVPSTAPEAPARRLVILEDDSAFAGILADIARERGYIPEVIGRGDLGLDAVRRLHPVGVLLDMMLPGKEGHTVLEALKQDPETRTIPVCIISALEPDQQLARDGAVGFFAKPVNPEQIHHAIDRIEWVAQRRPKTLLVVDDDRTDLDAIQSLLADWPIRVIRCDTGKEAIHLARTTELDGILLDWGLNDISGSAVLDALEPMPPGAYVPVILYTGRTLDRGEEAELRKRIVAVVVKGDQAPQRLRAKLAFYLHLEPPAETREPEASRPPQADADLQGKRILVVDDDMRNAFSLAAIIEAWGAESHVAADGQKALELLEADPAIDLVLMDIMMPGMDGYAAMREIRGRRSIRNVPIIALTAKAMKQDREACMEAGANDYLAKPVDLDQLLLLVKSWVRR